MGRKKKAPKIKTPIVEKKTDLRPPTTSVMDDDAMIYQKEREKTEKEKWKEMNAKDKFTYFLDYYALKVACILFIVVCAVYFTVNYFTKEDPAFYLLAMNVDGEEERIPDSEYFDPFLEEQGIDTDKNVVSVDVGQYNQNTTGDSLGVYSMEKIRVMFMAQTVDVFWSDEEFLSEMSSTGYVADLKEFVSEELLERYKDDLIYDKDVETGEEIVVGIRIDAGENQWLSDTGWYEKEAIVSAAQGAPHPELMKEMLLDILE